MKSFPEQADFFKRALATGRLAQAYLFSGAAPLAFAVELADQLGGEKMLAVDGGIDAVRAVRNFLSLTPLSGRYKTAIINAAHQLTDEAQNALLKTLEEPSPAALIILITPYPSALLPTVLSRCQTVHFVSAPAVAGAEAGRAPGLLLSRLAKFTLAERFAFAKKISEDKDQAALRMLAGKWLAEARADRSQPRFVKLARALLTLQQTLDQPQFNARLALENFLVNL